MEFNEETMRLLEDLAHRLKTTPSDLTQVLADVLASYKDDIESWGLELKVRKEHRIEALFEELVYYAVSAKKGIVDRVLDKLKAKGRFELENLELDPDSGSLEIEFVALEGSDLEADAVRVGWSPEGVIVEALYYLEEDIPPARLPKPKDPKIVVDYLPDEHAILVTATGKSLSEIPPIHVLDRIALGGV